MTNKTTYGYWSDKMYTHFQQPYHPLRGQDMPAVFLYFTPDHDHGPVLVTAVGSEPNPRDAGYMWDDMYCIGEVTTFIRNGYTIGELADWIKYE